MLVRNLLFDLRILHSEKFDIPTISVGNLSTGGTGKSPHIEYLIRLLGDKETTATLSRGYSRESSGFILASKNSNVKEIGDEPLQFVTKFNNIKVAVDEKRVRGIQKLTAMFPGLRVLRHRLFESNVPMFAPRHRNHPLVFTHDKRKKHYGQLDQNVSFVQVTGGGNCTIANARAAPPEPSMSTRRPVGSAPACRRAPSAPSRTLPYGVGYMEVQCRRA